MPDDFLIAAGIFSSTVAASAASGDAYPGHPTRVRGGNV